MDAALFATGLATYYAAHQVADHVLAQSDRIATEKVLPGFTGWSAIFSHVVQYHVVAMFMLIITISMFNLNVTWYGLVSSIMFSAITHAIIDRRWPVRFILEKTGSPNFAKMTSPLCGMYLADQSLHYFCLWISAILLCI
jgi:hypothetical protein